MAHAKGRRSASVPLLHAQQALRRENLPVDVDLEERASMEQPTERVLGWLHPVPDCVASAANA